MKSTVSCDWFLAVVAIGAVLASLLGSVACEDDEVGDVPPLGRATVDLQLVTTLEPDANQTGFAELEHVYVTWDEIRLDRQGSQDVVLTPTEPFDLLDHVDAPASLFGTVEIPAGSYRTLSWVASSHEMIGTDEGEECLVTIVGGQSPEYVIRDSAGNPDPLLAEDGGSYTLVIETVTRRLDCQSGWLRDADATEVRRR